MSDELNRARFEELAAVWRRERPRGVDLDGMVDTPAYREVVAMGNLAVRPILLSLLERADHWFPALRGITGEDPVEPDDQGYLGRMSRAWVRWGYARGYLTEDDLDRRKETWA